MNKLVQELIRPFLGEVESKYDLVVYGGGFKPPTSGHLSTALRAYQIPAKKHQIVVGGGVRDKITSDSSIKIWQLYQNKEGLPNLLCDIFSLVSLLRFLPLLVLLILFFHS